MPASIVVRTLTPGDAEVFLRVRIVQVELEAGAFAASPAEVRARTAAMIAERLAAPHDETFVLGAFAVGELVAPGTVAHPAPWHPR